MHTQAISPWAAAIADKFNDQDLPNIYQKIIGNYTYSVHNIGDSLWLIISWHSGGRIAVRMAYSPNSDIRITRLTEKDGQVTFYIDAVIGSYSVRLEMPVDNQIPVLRYTTTLKPVADLFIPFWPRDIIALNKDGNEKQPGGKIHASQWGTRTGFVYFSMERPQSGSVYYVQNLTALADYCQETETSGADTVGGQWPELGFALPPAVKKPLPASKEFIISDGFLALSEEVPADELKMSRQFMDLLAAIYLRLPLPKTQYRDWQDITNKCLNDLVNSHGCWSHADGHDYLNAYVSDYDTPPEIMVQLAVLLPLYEYSLWSDEEIPAVKKIIDGLSAFYDKELGTINRWLPALVDELDESEEQLKPYVMDAWYLHHPMVNLARMALDGDKITRKLFLDSLEYMIKVAHRFEYKWPVFYDMRSLEIIKGNKQPGQGGEGDVAGLYAFVMLHAWDLTKDDRYLNEAKKAAKSLLGLGFDLFYQANNTALAAKAMIRLWNITKDKIYLDLSFLCLTNIFRNMQLWDCNYGYGKHYSTFFAVFPLADAPYTAAYEEAEVFACIHNYLELAADEDLPESVSLLLAEFIRYIVERVAYYYPPNLPKEILSEEVKMGKVDPDLWIALEDIHDGWEKSGKVGQEVYGAGVAFGIVPRHYLKVPGQEFLIYCDYPVTKFTKKGKTVSFDVRGDSRLTCRMMIVKKDKQALPEFKVYQKGEKEKLELKGKPAKRNLEFTVTGNSKVTVTWG
ncbi:hypothetical protein ACFQZS_13825 [Mucilaginibacter calamicampi]|uniref:Alpha-L-rhamnosidase six-hairpin glycosidase domain-containing protein n=1 Tax=Mucilaginibacter calamicampi TaxID=1302352 RepID=A0ABW2Z038_9SPHI